MKMSLCPMCNNCPEVEILGDGDEVRIGEAGNLAVLKKDEWNVLVELIQPEHMAKILEGSFGAKGYAHPTCTGCVRPPARGPCPTRRGGTANSASPANNFE